MLIMLVFGRLKKGEVPARGGHQRLRKEAERNFPSSRGASHAALRKLQGFQNY